MLRGGPTRPDAFDPKAGAPSRKAFRDGAFPKRNEPLYQIKLMQDAEGPKRMAAAAAYSDRQGQ